MKKIISMILALTMLCGIAVPSFAKGEEVPEGYTPIRTAQELDNIRNNLSGKYILMNDIVLGDKAKWEPIGKKSNPFTGEINGNGYAIKNLFSEEGFVAYSENALFSDLNLVNCRIDGTEAALGYAAAISINAVNTTFERCFVSGEIICYTGENAIMMGTYGAVGGFAACAENCSVINCANQANIKMIHEVADDISVGGIIGKSINSKVINCYCSGKVSAEILKEIAPYVEPSVYEKVHTGGLVGSTDDKSVFENCYFADSTDNAVGNGSPTLRQVEKLSKTEMLNQSAYKGFDFENIWEMKKEKTSFPMLKSPSNGTQLISVDIIYVPLKNRFVFKEGNTEYPDGILLKLTYSDNTEVIEEIKENGYEYYAGNEKVVFFTKVIDVIIYGKMNGHLEMKDGEIQLDYNFYSLKPFTIYNRTAYLFFCNIIDGLIRHIIVSFNSLLNRF